MTNLTALKPTQKLRIYDILEELGFDMADWTDSLKDKNGNPSANPKYCFRWSYIREDEQVIVLNLWHEEMKTFNDSIYQEHSFKQYAIEQVKGRKTRSLGIDKAIRLAHQKKLPVHVVVCSGSTRSEGVKKRELDVERWFVTGYDYITGACIIERGPNYSNVKLIDQFEANDIVGKSNQYQVNGNVYVRSSYIRRRVLMRAKGLCEYCLDEGFITNSGARYLETHHIIPLCEQGEDKEENVIALCPNDHKRAHFEKDSQLTKEKLFEIVNSKMS